MTLTRNGDAGRSWSMLVLVTFILLVTSPRAYAQSQSDSVRRAELAATVRIISEITDGNRRMMVTGSGILLGHGDYVATNWHVIDANQDGRFDGPVTVAALVDGQIRETRGDLAWGASPTSKDVAILKLASPFIDIAPKVSLFAGQGDQVWAIGFPGKSDQISRGIQARLQASFDWRNTEFLQPTVNVGTVTRLRNSLDTFGGAQVLQHQVPINHGNSGGPLYDSCGALVGLNNAGFDDAQGTNFAIHVSELIPGLRKLNVPYTVVGRCDPTGTAVAPAPVRTWPMWLGLGLSIVIAGAALAVATTSRGRAAVSRVTQRWGPTPQPRRPPAPIPPAVSPPLVSPAPPVAPGARIRAVEGEFRGLELEIGAEPVTLGRDPNIRGLVFMADESMGISKRHCELRFDDQRRALTITDLNSSNGTLMSGTRLTPFSRKDLRPGDRFALGSSVFEVLPS